MVTSPVEAPARVGRPRSEDARVAVLHAVDDLLVEVGYAAMTMKGIAAAAGVGRATVYRWWSTKAEILLEACVHDAGKALATPVRPDAGDDLATYLRALARFLTLDPAGLAYRALVGEAQHDEGVRSLLAGADVLATSAHAVLDRVRPAVPGVPPGDLAVAQLVGPLVGHVLTTGDALPPRLLRRHVEMLLTAWGRPPDADT